MNAMSCPVTDHDEQVQDASAFFKVLGDPTRMRLLCALQDARCVGDLATVLNMSQSAVSHQLSILRQARLVRLRRAGKQTIYTLADEHVEQIISLALVHVRELYKDGGMTDAQS
jgi:ArsR family transcriptional regulator